MNSIKGTFWTAAALLGLVAIFALPAAADQQILDDLIVDGSACIGQDCVNGESFGFDTLRLKENNLRLHFQDTSTSASFPTVDWRITANDSSNGGANYLAVENVDGGIVPFRIKSTAPNNALVVSNSIGIGTATPVTDIHVVSGNTPTLRLEQNGTSGFAPQTFDVAGNEANFFIRDATNASRLFFRAKPGAATDSIFIAADGDVGFGKQPFNAEGITSATDPDVLVHRTDGATLQVLNNGATSSATVLAESNGARPARLLLVNTLSDWRFSNTAAGFLSIQTAGGNGMTLQTNGDVAVDGILTKGGGAFRIDHPMDPENRFLQHSFVESPEMLNIYNGNVQLDAEGRSVVELPDWFQALNRDYRYQLTAIGAAAPELHVARGVEDGTFEIAGGAAGLTVSWQVTGIRDDAFARANRIDVEVAKTAAERGLYLHPAAFGLPPEMGIGRAQVVEGDEAPKTERVAP